MLRQKLIESQQLIETAGVQSETFLYVPRHWILIVLQILSYGAVFISRNSVRRGCSLKQYNLGNVGPLQHGPMLKHVLLSNLSLVFPLFSYLLLI